MARIQSVKRATEILKTVADSPTGQMRTSEIAAALALEPSTTSRLLCTLCDSGLLERDTETGRYRLGLVVLGLARAVCVHLDLANLAMPCLARLMYQCNESSYVSILRGLEAVTICQITATSRLTSTRPTVGNRFSAHATSGGKVLLAHACESGSDTTLLQGLVKYTPYTIVDPDELLREFSRILRQGYSIAREELEIGLVGVAAPIRDEDGDVVAAVSMSSTTPRASEQYTQMLTDRIISTGKDISRALGWNDRLRARKAR